MALLQLGGAHLRPHLRPQRVDYGEPLRGLDVPEGPAVAGFEALGESTDAVDRADRFAERERAVGANQRAVPALASFMTAREAPRVPFSALLERGLVTPGIRLVDAKKRHQALVRADGALALGETVGSIHRIGAIAQGLEACNGWTFWHVETPQGLTVIDALRARVRAEMGVE